MAEGLKMGTTITVSFREQDLDVLLKLEKIHGELLSKGTRVSLSRLVVDALRVVYCNPQDEKTLPPQPEPVLTEDEKWCLHIEAWARKHGEEDIPEDTWEHYRRLKAALNNPGGGDP